MAVNPRVLVDPPSIAPDSGSLGLFSAAVPQTNAPSQWQLGGVEYLSDGLCAKPEGWTYVCPPATPADMEATQGFEILGGDPFTAYLGISCALPGHTLDEFAQRVRASFLANVEPLVEQAFWTGDQGNDPHLADATAGAVHVVAPAAAPLSLQAGLGALEEYLGLNLAGRAFLHAPRVVAPYAATAQLLVDPGTARMRTPLGSRWVFGSGYAANIGPDEVAAPAGVAWIYATGQVNLWRSDVFVNPDDLRYGFNTRSNEVEIFAEQTFALTRECLTAAVAVSLSCDC